MKNVVITLINALGAKLSNVLLGLMSVLKEFLKYMNFLREEKKEEKEEMKKEKEKQELKQENEKIKDACDNGTVEDLINL